MDHAVAPAAYFIARINHESKSFLRQNCRFLTDANDSNLEPAMDINCLVFISTAPPSTRSVALKQLLQGFICILFDRWIVSFSAHF